MKKLFELNQINFAYDLFDEKTGEARPDKPCLCDISFSVEEGSFVLVCGDTGSGKSTLLRYIKEQLSSDGQIETALLLQNPKDQCVTDKVWHELAFGMENRNFSIKEMDQRIAETASFFDLEKLLSKETGNLSGGELQLVNLAALMTARPKLLLLDEPTAQLDPAAEQRFLNVLSRIHNELGITILMAEHNLKESLSLATHLLAIEDGRVLSYGNKEEVLTNLADRFPADLPAVTAFAQKHRDKLTDMKAFPYSILQGRMILRDCMELLPDNYTKPDESTKNEKHFSNQPSLVADDVWFRFQKKTPDVLCGVNACFYPGNIYAILGGNGAGKTTLLRLLAGALKADEGKLKAKDKLAYLPQNPETLFLTDSLIREAKSMGKMLSDLPECLREYGQKHPYDLSGGEKELLALWKVLATEAKILLLDEPQKGLDPEWRAWLKKEMFRLREKGYTIIFVSHDTDFVAEIADYCSMLSNGRLGMAQNARQFFLSNYFYTTPVVRLTRDLADGYVTREELLC